MKLVLLPGMDGTGHSLRSVVPYLADQGIEAQALGYPGDQVMGYDRLEQWIRDRLPFDEPFWVGGESFSGPLAVRLAANPPPGLVGVTLIVSFVTNPIWPGFRTASKLVGALPFHGPPPFWFMRKLLMTGVSDREMQSFADEVREVRPEVMGHRVLEMNHVDVRAELKGAKVPVTYLRANQDRMVGHGALREVVRLRPGIRVQSIDGPHLVLLARPEAAARALSRLVRAGAPALAEVG
jgi:pimeloyl-ACP methyl ester carboxylesterase